MHLRASPCLLPAAQHLPSWQPGLPLPKVAGVPALQKCSGGGGPVPALAMWAAAVAAATSNSMP